MPSHVGFKSRPQPGSGDPQLACLMMAFDLSHGRSLGGRGSDQVAQKPQRVESRVSMAQPVIVIDREVMSGTPCLRGTRVPFKNLIDYLKGGPSLSEILRQFTSA